MAGGGTENILSEIPEGASLILTNTGSTPLTFCVTQDAATVCSAGAVLDPGDETIVSPEDIGPPGSTFLNVTNGDPVAEGAWRVVVVT